MKQGVKRGIAAKLLISGACLATAGCVNQYGQYGRSVGSVLDEPFLDHQTRCHMISADVVVRTTSPLDRMDCVRMGYGRRDASMY